MLVIALIVFAQSSQPATAPAFLIQPGKTFYHRAWCVYIASATDAEPIDPQTHVVGPGKRPPSPCPVCCSDLIPPPVPAGIDPLGAALDDGAPINAVRRLPGISPKKDATAKKATATARQPTRRPAYRPKASRASRATSYGRYSPASAEARSRIARRLDNGAAWRNPR
jgi:hypothetical protein